MQAEIKRQPEPISIHAPAKGATPAALTVCGAGFYFNPRSREGSDQFREHSLSAIKISIHAPAKGATYLTAGQFAIILISIHAPAKGATSAYFAVS